MKWNRKFNEVIIKAKLRLDTDIERAHRVERRKKKGSANANEPPTNLLSSRLEATRTSSKKSPDRKARWFSPHDQWGRHVVNSKHAAEAKADGKFKVAKQAGKIAYFVLHRLVIRDKPAS